MLALLACVIVIVWIVPMWVGRQIGKPKRRAGGWWGFWLGWLGVLVVALLPPKEEPREWDRVALRWKDAA